MKGETVDEIAGMARVMREHALRVETEGVVVDTCGTGGDASGTFNVSTAAAFVVAGAGAKVAKHGNRAMSSACGSADVLEALGAKIDLNPDQVGQCLREAGIGFMFAQVFHPAMKYVAPARREIGIRTAFNILGPLTNPAGARCQLLGVARPELAPMIAAVLSRLGTHHALVVHGDGGLDELSLTGESHVHEVKDGAIREYFVSPEELGLAKAPLEAVKGGTPEENASKLRSVLAGERGPLRDIVALNAAAALVAADVAPDLKAGVQLAAETIDSGAAKARLETFLRVTQGFG
jgi:anthranilate phosphoribosyltransferase